MSRPAILGGIQSKALVLGNFEVVVDVHHVLHFLSFTQHILFVRKCPCVFLKVLEELMARGKVDLSLDFIVVGDGLYNRVTESCYWDLRGWFV